MSFEIPPNRIREVEPALARGLLHERHHRTADHVVEVHRGERATWRHHGCNSCLNQARIPNRRAGRRPPALTEDSAAIVVFVAEPAQRAPQHIQAPVASMTVECS
jgi:hypothetical protein